MRHVADDPLFDGEVNPGVLGPLRTQDRIALQAARRRQANLVTGDDPLAREAKLLGVRVLSAHGRLDHSRRLDRVSVDSHGRLEQLAPTLAKLVHRQSAVPVASPPKRKQPFQNARSGQLLESTL